METRPILFADWEQVLAATVPAERREPYREAIVKFRYWQTNLLTLCRKGTRPPRYQQFPRRFQPRPERGAGEMAEMSVSGKLTLKGSDATAQGETLGAKATEVIRPEGASQERLNGVLHPFRAQICCETTTQGFTLGCHIPPLRG